MAQVALVAAAFLSMLVFVTFVVRYELGLTPVVSATVGVSTIALGLPLATVARSHFGLAMRETAVVLALLVLVLALAAEALD